MPPGALAAAMVGGSTLAASFRCGATLLAFYFSSSRLTALAESRKETDDAFKPGGQRDWRQARHDLDMFISSSSPYRHDCFKHSVTSCVALEHLQIYCLLLPTFLLGALGSLLPEDVIVALPRRHHMEVAVVGVIATDRCRCAAMR